MADEDRTVQVPVSLIERVTAVCERLTARITDQRDVDAVSDLRALLSQLPVSLPTREQIAAIEALRHAADRDRPFGMTALVTVNDLDAVLALFSQPTPTAERHAYTCTCDACRVPLVDKVAELGQAIAGPNAEPPRIEDLAPGTTFRAKFRNEDRERFLIVVNEPEWPVLDPIAADQYQYSRIDPSTIRDVNPPKGDDHA